MDKQQCALRQSGVGLALMLGLGGFMLTGCHHDDEAANNTTPPPAVKAGPKTGPQKPGTVAGGPGGQARPGMPGGPGSQPRPGMPGAPGRPPGPGGKKDPFAGGGAPPPGGPGAPATGAAPGTQVASIPTTGKHHDPFYITWHVDPPPPDVFAEVQPIRVASAGYAPPPEQEVTVREVPDRRVSGIMSGDGVFAIIEQNGRSEVVKPGGTTEDGYRVLAINEDSVKLQKKVGNLNYTQTVQLSDVQSGAPTQYGNRQGALGQPGFSGGPGLGRPGPGRPGLGSSGGGKGD